MEKQQAKMRAAKQKSVKQVMQKEIEKMPRSNLTVDQLFRMSGKERDEYMQRYFEMRIADYYIQSYTRYGAEPAAQANIIEGFNARN